MATNRDQKTKGQRVSSTKNQEEKHMRQEADSTGQARGAMPDTPTKMGKAPHGHNTADPKPFPSQQRRSGPGRKFEPEE